MDGDEQRATPLEVSERLDDAALVEWARERARLEPGALQLTLHPQLRAGSIASFELELRAPRGGGHGGASAFFSLDRAGRSLTLYHSSSPSGTLHRHAAATLSDALWAPIEAAIERLQARVAAIAQARARPGRS